MPLKSLKIFFFVGVIASLILGSHAYAETWKITSLDWQPYSGAEMSTQGNSIQKLRTLLEKEGITLIVEFYPWKRAQFLAGKKEYVGYFPAWPEEVAKGFVGSSPVDWSSLEVMKRTGTQINFDTVDELYKAHKVGIVSTYVYPIAVEEAMKKYPDHTDKSMNEVTMLKKLSGGRFDAALTDPNVMLYLAGKEGIGNIEPAEKIIEKKPLVVAFRQGEDNKNRIDLLEKLLKQ